MRTTLDIDDDVLQAAREYARRSKVSIGQALTQLARAGLNRPDRSARRRKPSALGITPFPSRGEVITNEHVNRLRDELGV
ncbi:MAG: CopG family transcriptional regulator [Burkholderiales bacterium]